MHTIVCWRLGADLGNCAVAINGPKKKERINLNFTPGKSQQDLLDKKRGKKLKKANNNFWRGLRQEQSLKDYHKPHWP
jgi:hypothetical protein